MKEYLQLQSVIHEGSKITDIEEKKNRVYFKIDNYQFSTFGSYIWHEKHVLFDHPITDIWAEKENTAEGIEKHEKEHKEISDSIDLWLNNKVALFKIIFIKAVEILITKGEEDFIEYIEHHFQIMEERNNCHKLLNMLNKVKW